MKKYTLSLLTLLLALYSFGQKETRNLDSYDAIKVSGGVALELLDGSPKAEIEVTKGDLDKFVTEVDGNTLTIKFGKSKRWGWNSGNQQAKVKLYGAQNIERLDASAGSNVYSDMIISTRDFEANVSSGARIDLEVESSDMEVSVSSGASAEIAGSTKDLNVSSSSGASFRGKGLKAANVDAKASSGAATSVWVTDHLEASASSGGSVKYKGDPSSKDISSGKYSGGSVSKAK